MAADVTTAATVHVESMDLMPLPLPTKAPTVPVWRAKVRHRVFATPGAKPLIWWEAVVYDTTDPEITFDENGWPAYRLGSVRFVYADGVDFERVFAQALRMTGHTPTPDRPDRVGGPVTRAELQLAHG